MKQEETEFFKTDDMVACPCGCGMTITDPELWERLDMARRLADIPFTINSGARCVWHNTRIKGSPSSSHLKGLAVDIGCTTSQQRKKIVFALLSSGFKRIGIAPLFIHADVDSEKAQDIIYLY